MVDEEASGDESPLRQGAGTELLELPIWESRWWRNNDGFWKINSAPKDLLFRGIYRRKEGTGAGPT